MALANLFTFSGAVRSQVIYIEHRPLYHVYSTLLGLVVLIPANLLLIPQLGAVGAAMGVAAACFVSAVASSWVFPALRVTGLDQALAFLGIKRRIAADAPSSV
jgi:O-antigen/teichoic acid export membrane protein